jgi:hypothetical protein
MAYDTPPGKKAMFTSAKATTILIPDYPPYRQEESSNEARLGDRVVEVYSYLKRLVLH